MIKFNAAPDLAAELERVIQEHPEDMKLDSVGPAVEPSNLKLGLAELSTIVAIINGAITIGKFAHSVFKYLKKNPGERLTIQTPLRTVEIHGSDATSEDNVADLLQRSLDL